MPRDARGARDRGRARWPRRRVLAPRGARRARRVRRGRARRGARRPRRRPRCARSRPRSCRGAELCVLVDDRALRDALACDAADMRVSADRIVVVRRALPGLGEMLCAIPALRALRGTAPRATISLVGLDAGRWIPRRFDTYVDEFIYPFPGFPGMPHAGFDASATLRFFTEMHERDFDLAVQLQGADVAANAFTQMLGANRTAGTVLPGTEAPDDFYVELHHAEAEPLRLVRVIENLGARPTRDAELEFIVGDNDEAELAEQGLGSTKDRVPAHGPLGHPARRQGRRRARRARPAHRARRARRRPRDRGERRDGDRGDRHRRPRARRHRRAAARRGRRHLRRRHLPARRGGRRGERHGLRKGRRRRPLGSARSRAPSRRRRPRPRRRRDGRRRDRRGRRAARRAPPRESTA